MTQDYDSELSLTEGHFAALGHLIDTIRANPALWPPQPGGADLACVAVGDEFAAFAVRCYAAGGLSDSQIAHRLARGGRP